MKNNLLLLLSMLFALISRSQSVETFTNIGNSTSYGTRTWSGDNGQTWSVTDSREDQSITSKAITIRDGGLTFGLTSLQKTSGIGSLTLKAKAPFGSDTGSLQLVVNGTIISSKSVSGTTSTYTWNSINVSAITSIVINQRTSGARITIDDISWNSYTACTPAVITAVFPNTAPVGTEVIINASSGSLLGSTVDFNGVLATIVSSSALQLVVVVPPTATTGLINITNTTTGCVTTTPIFTIINKDVSSCQAGYPTTTDLIIYEIHDEKSGSGGTVTFYNGTGATINMLNYRLYRTGVYGDGNDANYATLTGTIAPGALGVIHVGSSDTANSCMSPARTNGYVSGGFNDDDGISLRNSAGTFVIDDVHAYSAGPGFYMVRNIGAYSPRSTFVPADWSTTALGSGVCDPRLGTGPTASGTVPTVNSQPTLSLSCSATTASISVAAVEGFVGGNALVYQWYGNAPSTTTWTALTNTGVYTGATSSNLNISSLVGLEGYQYYCQVKENTATCYVATVAVKISTGATTWNGSVWSNGTPTLSKAVTINGNYTTQTNGSFSACSLIVNATFNVTISPNNYIEIQNGITNNGTIDVQNNGSLIQIDNSGVDTGSISVKRDASQRLSDYVYWSSPVQNFGLSYFNTTGGTNYIYEWNTTRVNPNGGEGNWNLASGNMTSGKGYIVRGNSNFNNAASTTWTSNFTGVPNNGIISVFVERGNDYTTVGSQGIPRTVNDDNWNLLGNPYPSAIGVKEFLTANTNINGGVKIWTHTQLPTSVTDPFYQNFQSNYYPSDYITVNPVGATSGPGDYKIGAGQGFFIMLDNAAVTPGIVTFNNSMRDKVFANNQFYRANNTKSNSGLVNQGRIWLDLVSKTQTTRTLLGYVEEATYGKDRILDVITDYKSSQNIYSLINGDPMIIQGRPLPFDPEDKVAMGVKIPSTGSYTIAIGFVDGFFSDKTQKIYLEDTYTNAIVDISQAPYTFVATQGICNDRFVVRYTNQTLATTTFDIENSVKVFATEKALRIVSTSEKVKEVIVYNVLGQKLAAKEPIEKEVEINTLIKSNQALVVKVVLNNNDVIVKKIIY